MKKTKVSKEEILDVLCSLTPEDLASFNRQCEGDGKEAIAEGLKNKDLKTRVLYMVRKGSGSLRRVIEKQAPYRRDVFSEILEFAEQSLKENEGWVEFITEMAKRKRQEVSDRNRENVNTRWAKGMRCRKAVKEKWEAFHSSTGGKFLPFLRKAINGEIGGIKADCTTPFERYQFELLETGEKWPDDYLDLKHLRDRVTKKQ